MWHALLARSNYVTSHLSITWTMSQLIETVVVIDL